MNDEGKLLHLSAALVALLCFALDAATKFWARCALAPGEVRPFIPHFLSLFLVENSGCAFSLGRNNAQTVTLVSTAIFLLLLFWSIHRYQSNVHSFIEELSMAMVLGSALGNLVDRYVYGKVTDFLNFEFVSFPVFNVADILIDVGIAILLVVTLRNRKDSDNRSGNP